MMCGQRLSHLDEINYGHTKMYLLYVIKSVLINFISKSEIFKSQNFHYCSLNLGMVDLIWGFMTNLGHVCPQMPWDLNNTYHVLNHMF